MLFEETMSINGISFGLKMTNLLNIKSLKFMLVFVNSPQNYAIE